MDSLRELALLNDMLPLLDGCSQGMSARCITFFKLQASLEFACNIPGIGRATTVGLAVDIWVLVLVTNVKTKVVDDITSVLDNIGTLGHVPHSGVAAKVLKGRHVVWVGSSRQTGKDALLGEEEGSSADRHDGTLPGRIFLLDLGKLGDKVKWLSLGLDYSI